MNRIVNELCRYVYLLSETIYARYLRVSVYESVSTSLVSVSVGCLSILGDRTLFRSPVYFPILEIGLFETIQPGSCRLQIISCQSIGAHMRIWNSRHTELCHVNGRFSRLPQRYLSNQSSFRIKKKDVKIYITV